MLRFMMAICAVGLLAVSANAATIVGWDFDDQDGNHDQKDPAVTASAFAFTGGTNSFDGSIGDCEAGEAATKDAGYWEFTVSIGGGQVLDLDRLVFDTQVERWGSGRSAMTSVALVDALDNETPLTMDLYVPDEELPANQQADDASVLEIGQNGGYFSGADEDGLIVVDLAGVAAADSFTFRIHQVRSGGLGFKTSIDDVNLTGTVVPEPATMALLGLGGLGVIVRRRRK